ncbi:MAG: ATP-dependent sacrificial sulfur transferase LarE [Candidatus Omnitrophica bacterium]|nr:ATP-dependent sacrificial sulfur transferase LarE [Candidatus Omnitrophota bacterium]MBU1905663.1 ATP-dependent sacrificial sulfur transferase LarE [Candidatus Omnitrophota bacterium]
MKQLAGLKKIISGYGSCLVAFSGGVDSTFLLKVASLVLPRGEILAVTADSSTYPGEELLFSKNIAKRLGVRHKIIKTSELKDKRFISNPINRCYYCKKELFKKLKKIAGAYKLNYVLDASNLTDEFDFRPGDIAKKELKIRSPLVEARLAKEDIRRLSKKLGLVTWDKPSLACLASRIPYGTQISRKLLNRVNRCENYLKRIGFRQVRLRHYNELCRIEVLSKDIPLLINKRQQVVNRLKKFGYDCVTVDLEGYRTGSMNLGKYARKNR